MSARSPPVPTVPFKSSYFFFLLSHFLWRLSFTRMCEYFNFFELAGTNCATHQVCFYLRLIASLDGPNILYNLIILFDGSGIGVPCSLSERGQLESFPYTLSFDILIQEAYTNHTLFLDVIFFDYVKKFGSLTDGQIH